MSTIRENLKSKRIARARKQVSYARTGRGSTCETRLGYCLMLGSFAGLLLSLIVALA